MYAWISASVVLHNLLRDCNDEWEPEPEPELELVQEQELKLEQEPEQGQEQSYQGQAKYDYLIEQFIEITYSKQEPVDEDGDSNMSEI